MPHFVTTSKLYSQALDTAWDIHGFSQDPLSGEIKYFEPTRLSSSASILHYGSIGKMLFKVHT
jgi:hypothetical protein